MVLQGNRSRKRIEDKPEDQGNDEKNPDQDISNDFHGLSPFAGKIGA